jgi:GT2 family glycosyltransferase
MSISIFAIVVTYNGSKWINKCFGSLVSSTIPVKILAIDNASSDGTPDIIREKFPQVEVIETGLNLGFGKANNIGLKRVLAEDADYAFLLNQDAWVEGDTIEKLVEVHQKHSEFGILSPVPYDGTGEKEDYLFSEYYKNKIHTKKKYLNKTFEIEFINAAGWLITIDTIEKIGGFHPKFKIHGEDTNYTNRIHCLGLHKIGITFATKYYHDRQKRKTIEHTQKKRIYALKNKIKTSMFNPNNNSTKILLFNILSYSKAIITNPLSYQVNFIGCFYSFVFFIKSTGHKNIHFKL